MADEPFTVDLMELDQARFELVG